MYDPSSFANPTPLAHADTSRDVLPRRVGRIMKETLPKVCEDLHEEFDTTKKKVQYFRDELLQKVTENLGTDDKETYFQKLFLISLENIDEVAVQTYRLDYTFAIQIKEINTNLKSGPFNKADTIYPLYKDLAKTWKQMQLEGHLLNFYVNLFQDLKKFTEFS
ncbi:UNVERIFIED_CONTAM: hypothetical protein NCL1_20635 [Trichonephila clavipes]